MFDWSSHIILLDKYYTRFKSVEFFFSFTITSYFFFWKECFYINLKFYEKMLFVFI